MEIETNESSFEVIKIPVGIYQAVFLREEEYVKEKDDGNQNRLKLFFSVSYHENGKDEVVELMYTVPVPTKLSPSTSLGKVLSALGLTDFSVGNKVNTMDYVNKICQVVVKDWTRIDNGQRVVSSQITDFMPLNQTSLSDSPKEVSSQKM